MLAVLLKREQGMSMVEEFAVIVSYNIAVERYQFHHSFQPFSLKAAYFRNKHL